MTELRDRTFMMLAIELARHAETLSERPFGCVIVTPPGVVVGEGWGSETRRDPTAHSEIQAICEASRRAADRRFELTGPHLKGCTLYSTHEPCLMCTGAIFHAKISRVAWGSSRVDLPDLFRELPAARWRMTSTPPELEIGVMHNECIRLFSKELVQKTYR